MISTGWKSKKKKPAALKKYFSPINVDWNAFEKKAAHRESWKSLPALCHQAREGLNTQHVSLSSYDCLDKVVFTVVNMLINSISYFHPGNQIRSDEPDIQTAEIISIIHFNDHSKTILGVHDVM